MWNDTERARHRTRRFGLNMISAVSARDDFRFMLHEGSVTAPVFRTFLQRLMTGPKQPVFLVVDGHPIYKAKLVKEYVAQQKERTEIVPSPPHLPQFAIFNPDELVWGHFKARVAR